jgi:hypothetical protein
MFQYRHSLLTLTILAVIVSGTTVPDVASATPQWLINGTAFHGEELISTKALSPFTLRAMLPGGTPVTYSCPTLASVGGRIFGNNKNAATELKFGPTCTVITPKCTLQAEITTGAVNSETTDLAGAEPLYIKFTPTTQPFTVLKVTECAGEGNFSIQGLASCKVTAPTVSAVEKLCTFNENTTLLGSLRFGVERMTLEGTAGYTLSGTNRGKPWSAIASDTASAAPQWLINGTAFSGTETISTKALGSGFTLRSTLPGGTPMVVSCPSAGTIGGQISGSNKGSATKTAFGPTCLVTTPKCRVQAEITLAGVNFEATDLAGAEPLYLKFTPTTQPFTTVKITECAGEGNFNIQGLMSCKIAAPTVSAVEKLCAFNENRTLLGSLRFGTEPITLSGTAGFRLSGTNTGKPWSSNL